MTRINLKEQFIKEYGDYVVRRLGRYLIAIPKDSNCWAHQMGKWESNESAYEHLIKVLPKPKK